jgi:hypothetical protein
MMMTMRTTMMMTGVIKRCVSSSISRGYNEVRPYHRDLLDSLCLIHSMYRFYEALDIRVHLYSLANPVLREFS